MPDLSGGQKFSFPTLFNFYREVFLTTIYYCYGRYLLLLPGTFYTCASRNGPRTSDFLKKIPTKFNDSFARFMTMREKKVLARAFRLQKGKIGDNNAFFRDI